jgi:hypothetical protein
MSLQLKRLEIEYHKVAAARRETEMRLLEREEETKRILENLKSQTEREAQLSNEIEKLKKEQE